MCPQKNHSRLIRQFSDFCTNNKTHKLIILGEGELKDELQEMIHQHKLTDRVMIQPYTSNPFAFIKKAAAIVLSSRYEGLPNVLLESMVIGRPIIATDCLSGPRELLGSMVDYESQIESISYFERGIVVSNDATEDTWDYGQ